MTEARLLEFKREYVCSRCKKCFVLEADYIKMFSFEVPRNCLGPAGTCKGNLHPKNSHPKPEYCMDYQEIRIQELFGEKNVPGSLVVSLENDLVVSCHPGECITVCGTIERRWRPIIRGKRSEVVIALRAVSICKDEENINVGKDLSEQLISVRAQWQDTIDSVGQLNARDMIIQSICPEIHGMYLVKLAIALALCSGMQCSFAAGDSKRGNSHLLLVGDPGLAKSKLLKSASRIALRSVHTTGMGCSAAGLTAAAIKEEGEWHLEAGALVLADGGICCIDEFNLMRETDKASIHEAMEQQTISMAKAGLVCKLNTRCVVLAATNPKNLYTMSESEGTSFINIGIGAPLLSRFDIVLILRDERDPEWDNRISDHILKNTNCKTISDDIWDMDRLQSHFLAVQNINPQLTDEANIILASYYKYCRSDAMRDPSRTTVRLLDSLNRLAQSHARLMFRDRVEAIDAIAIIRLMESSWGFGRLLNSIHILRENLPLGPNESQIREVVKLLDVENLENCIFEKFDSFNTCYSDYQKRRQNQEETIPKIGNLESLFGFNRNNVNKVPKNSSDNGSKRVQDSTSKSINNCKENVDLTSTTLVVGAPNKLLSKIKETKICKDVITENGRTTVKSSIIESILLEDSGDFDLLENFEFGSKLAEDKIQTNLSTTIKPAEVACTSSAQTINSTPLGNSSTNLLNRLFTPLDSHMIDDDDLEFDIPLSKPVVSLELRTDIQISKKPLKEISHETNRKSSDSHLSVRNITENHSTSSEASANKKPRILSQTLAKLNCFLNPNLVQTSPSEVVANYLLNGKSQKNETEDSAYDSLPCPLSEQPSSQSSSHILAAHDDDLSCLDFDI